MVSVGSIERDKKQIIKNFKPSEMESYLKSLVAILYESYLEHDLDKCSSAKRLIEEATEIYEAEGYVNSLSKELSFRLAKANEVLVNTLEEKDKLEIELSKVIVENTYSNYIETIINANAVLNSLLESYRKAPSEELALAIKDVAFIEDNNLTGIKFFIEDRSTFNNTVFGEELEILVNYYSDYKTIINEIRKLY